MVLLLAILSLFGFYVSFQDRLKKPSQHTRITDGFYPSSEDHQAIVNSPTDFFLMLIKNFLGVKMKVFSIVSMGMCFMVFMTGCVQKKPETYNLHQVRGVWLTNVDSNVLERPESLKEAVDFLYDHGFNTLFPVVWNQGYTLYPSTIMEKEFGIPIHPSFEGWDYLSYLTEYAHEKGLLVIPWFEYGFSSSYNAQGGHILRKNPHWAARDREGNLLTKNNFEWMNPYHPEVQNFIKSLLLEVIQQYDVDGIQGDDRLPANPIEGGYSEYTVFRYKQEHNGQEPPDNFRDPAWQRWRADILNAFAKEIYDTVKAINPNLLVSWAPNIYPWAYDEYLQDWPTWVKDGYCDLLVPQIYRYDFESYQKALATIHPDTLKLPKNHCAIVPGVLLNLGDYVIDNSFLREVITYNRKMGFEGEVFFFYEGLRKENNRTARLLKKEFYQ